MITNDMIVRFYSSIDMSDYSGTRTSKFEKEHRQKKDGYIGVKDVFISEGKNVVDTDDLAFYNELMGKEENGTFFNMHSLQYLNKGSGADFVFLRSCELNQKWHCLVSWYAYKEYKEEIKGKDPKQLFYKKIDPEDTTSIFQKKITCPELRLWLLEATASQSNNTITKDDVDDFFDKAILYKNCAISKDEWIQECYKATASIIPVIEDWNKENPKKPITSDAYSDPFYSESNIRYLEQKMADYKAGRIKAKEHDLID